MKNFAAIFLALGLALGGCVSDIFAPREDPTKFYILDAKPEAGQYAFDGAIELAPLILPGYLNRAQIASRGAGSAVEISEFNRWAEAPEGMFSRAFAKCLSASLPKAPVYTYPEISPAGRGNVCVVRIALEECIGVVGGEFAVSGKYTCIANGKSVFAKFSKKARAQGGYEGYVSAASKCVAEISADIAKTVSQLK